MSIKTPTPMSFAGNYVLSRIKKNDFLQKIEIIVDWKPIEKELCKICKRSVVDAAGRPSYSPLLLFKMLLLQTWYSLSDERVEDMVKDSLSAMHFCGLQIEDTTPDHSTLSRFRTELTAKGAMDRILKKFNKQLKEKNIIIQKGSVQVDASITESFFKPKGKVTYQIAEDRKEEDRPEEEKAKEESSQTIVKLEQPCADSEGRWLKKGKKCYYGYKRTVSTKEQGMVLSVYYYS